MATDMESKLTGTSDFVNPNEQSAKCVAVSDLFLNRLSSGACNCNVSTKEVNVNCTLSINVCFTFSSVADCIQYPPLFSYKSYIQDVSSGKIGIAFNYSDPTVAETAGIINLYTTYRDVAKRCGY
jgi:hypothetical protein